MEVRLGRGASAALLVCSFAACLFGQATDGNLVGTITDASGATVASADVKITNQATNIQSSTKSNSSGDYRFGNIPVGVYDLSVAAAGFSPATQKGVTIDLNKTTTEPQLPAALESRVQRFWLVLLQQPSYHSGCRKIHFLVQAARIGPAWPGFVTSWAGGC